jgi:ribonuclease P protein component
MLNKANRLTRDKEFEKVFKNARSAYNNLFSVKALSNNLSHNRFGIIVSLKVSKKAIERNKIKRRVREALRFFDDQITIHQDVVIVCRPSLINVNLKEIKNSLQLIFKRLKLINVIKLL